MVRLSSPDYRFQGLEFYSGNFSIRGDVLRETGSFNTKYSVSEDSELGLRMTNAGIEVVLESGAAAMQYIEKDFPGFAEYIIERGKISVPYTLDYPGTFPYRRICVYNIGSLKWRLFRNGLVWMSGIFPQFPALVARLVKRLEKIAPGRMNRYYSLSLDYYFWLGVSTALKQMKDSNELESKMKSHREPRCNDFISTFKPAPEPERVL